MFPTVGNKQLLRLGKIGSHTMRDEHFGINIVETMVAGLLTIAHDAAGPKPDIIPPAIKCGSDVSPMAPSVEGDDLESLFLVFIHCLWASYGKSTTDLYALWAGKKEQNSAIDSRIAWLGSKTSFTKKTGPSGCPPELEHLATGLYDCLFHEAIKIHQLLAESEDPRLDKIDPADLLAIFKAAIELSKPVTRFFMAIMKCFTGLREFVDKLQQPDDKENAGRSTQASPSKKRKATDDASGSNPKMPVRLS
ncbi:hypothetical protein EV179_001221 [Coemansia sp. RSA 487]|nr:hypothetical protein EV179_001221 [Coemansia sp. RSA 487]